MPSRGCMWSTGKTLGRLARSGIRQGSFRPYDSRTRITAYLFWKVGACSEQKVTRIVHNLAEVECCYVKLGSILCHLDLGREPSQVDQFTGECVQICQHFASEQHT